MTTETRDCQNCKDQFVIEPEDFDFYKKISVPPPTFCPKCRLQRRLATFNFRTLYKRVCDLCKQEKISMYPPNSPDGWAGLPAGRQGRTYKVYCPECWWSDSWDPLDYGKDYDFSKPFFGQFMELWREIPLLGLSLDLITTKTSPYNNHAGHLKNCYLLFQSDFDEDCSYGTYVVNSKSVFDCSFTMLSELCYDSMHSYKNSRCVGLRSQVTESLDCFFLRDCMNCQNCFASANLRGKKYHIFNKPYTKEEYFKEIKKWDLGSYRVYTMVQKLAEEHWKKFPPKPTMDDFSVNCTGSHVFRSKNCKECYEVIGAEDCKYLHMVQTPPVRDSYDVTNWGNNMDLCYEDCVVGENVSGVKFCQESGLTLYNAEYCKLSTGGSDHFGCVSMKKGKFVIFNKVYSESEYYKLRERIIAHMSEMPYRDARGRTYTYGEFFPLELSPFPYNNSVAQDFFPMTKEDIGNQGLVWRSPDIREYSITKQAADLLDNIKDVDDSILKEVIGCSSCERGFKIIPMEIQFLRRMNLPLPRECPTCRIGKKFGMWLKNLRILERACSKCGANFQTSYPEEEVEYILCKKCYLEEVV